ncbi:MAG: hypothetical protein AB7J35_15480 [Dehalococcoidia bacterium]
MRRYLIAAVASFAVALVFLAGDAHANGVPQLVKLTYLEGVSNFGPEDAEGVLEFSFAEAYARVDVKNLKPMDGYTYEGWLEGGSAPLRVGTIEVNSAGIGLLDTKLTGLSAYDYDIFMVTARPAGDTSDAVPAKVSIAGRFAVIGDEANKGAVGDVRPNQLPDTGEEPPASFRERAGRTLTIAAAAGGLAFVFLRVLNRKKVNNDQGTV